MFNLLVAANGEQWERDRLSMSADRFKEYSGSEADAIRMDRPDTLKRLEEVPALLLYEIGVSGPSGRLVRHGRLKGIALHGSDLTFAFVPDPVRAYLNRGAILTFADQLGMHQFEQNRTHWAVKDGDLPPGLLDTAVAARPVRTVSIVAAEYLEARSNNRRQDAGALREELETFAPSVEKALSLLPARLLEKATPELYPILGVKPGTPEARAAIDTVLDRDASEDTPPDSWPFSVAWFLGLYGSPTENAVRDEAVVSCRQHLNRLATEGAAEPSIEDISTALWRTARSHALAGILRREISLLLYRLVKRQDPDGYWSETIAPRVRMADNRATALATVVLQRLGDDRHHAAISAAVRWLLEQRREIDGALARRSDQPQPDVIATTFTMEAIRRSNLGHKVPHVIAGGEAWLLSAQSVESGWTAEPWPEDFVTAIVLEYLERRGAMLPQVDGFLLMARDFFRKAEVLRMEGGANDRRLAAIATVHAVEMFLYGVFEKRQDLALSAYKENGVETLGPRDALKGLQDSMHRLGLLTPPRRLPYRDQLSSLIGKRDGIIHRAHEISVAELDAGMKCARRFIEELGADLIGLDLVQ